MSTGILGSAAPSANTNTTVYTVPVGKTATFNVTIVNSGTYSALVRVAVAAASTPSSSEYIEYETLLEPSAVLERTGIVADAGKKVVVYASTATTDVNVYGYEE